ncbi:MAG: DUF1573 domain-containing protein [Tissierellia bacterium]|nr:DUF1573 domain-containing protein [Tissierellia bacterium]
MGRNTNVVNINKDLDFDEFQNQVDNVLIRHRSILDIITKLNEYTARINRAVVKSSTSCGCIEINTSKQDFNKNSLEEMKNSMESHISGSLCPGCREILLEEIGAYLFYLAALSNALDVNISEALYKEYSNIKTLGLFSLK